MSSSFEMGFETWWKTTEKSLQKKDDKNQDGLPPEIIKAIKMMCLAAWISARQPAHFA